MDDTRVESMCPEAPSLRHSLMPSLLSLEPLNVWELRSAILDCAWPEGGPQPFKQRAVQRAQGFLPSARPGSAWEAGSSCYWLAPVNAIPGQRRGLRGGVGAPRPNPPSCAISMPCLPASGNIGMQHTHFMAGIAISELDKRCQKNNKVTFGEYILSVTI